MAALLAVEQMGETKAVASGPNPNYHPDDDQLIREYLHKIDRLTERQPNWITIDGMPRSVTEALVRRVSNAF